jgi:hypothetical protein
MRYYFVKSIVLSATLTAILLGSCMHEVENSYYINLQGFSQKNYIALERLKGSNVCIKGRLTIDSMGVYYALQSVESDGVIDLGFSRVKTDLSRNSALGNGLSNGGIHTICGLLEESTPFKGCDDSDCKWYTLIGAQLRKK